MTVLNGILKDTGKQVVFNIENAHAGEVNFGHLMPATYGLRETPGNGTLAFELPKGTRKRYLANHLLKSVINDVSGTVTMVPLADCSLSLYHQKQSEEIITTVMRRWAREHPNAAVRWLQEARSSSRLAPGGQGI